MESRGCALVTGAGSGIGREMAKQLAAQGYSLILAARNEQRLRALARTLPVSCDIYVCDLSRRAEAQALAAYLGESRPEIVINNAGFGVFGDVGRVQTDRELAMIDVNVAAVHLLTAEALRMMRARGSGRILNVASSAGLFPGGPHMAGYYAGEAYVVSLTCAAAQELREEGSAITVSALCPGPVDTNFNRVAGVRFALPGIRAEDCARAGLEGMFEGKTIIVPERRLRLAAFAVRLLPRGLMLRLVSRQQQKKGAAGEADARHLTDRKNKEEQP